jgi:protein TonB
VPQVPPPERQQEKPRERPTEETQLQPDTEGAGEEVPEPEQQQPAIKLPPPGAWALPPSEGGLMERPDTEGGQSDAGGLSFDTQWYDWGPYAKAMLAKIRRHWRIPEIARLGVDGVVKIRFFIERDGTVTGLQIIDESGKPPMDFAARDAIAHSSPFEPLPADLGGSGREGVTITFFYNATPPNRGGR